VSIAGGGSVLRTFRAAVTMTCPRPGQPLAPPDVRPGLISAPPVRIAPDGRFVARRNAASGVTYWLEGRLTGTVVTGYASLRVGSCSGDLRFTARRR